MFLFASLNVSGQKDYKDIDRRTLNTPKDVEKDISSLSAYLVENVDDEIQKVRAFYIWISSHIRYDQEEGKKTHPKVKEIAQVLQEKKAVCIGYATIFKALCDNVDIPCEIISGYAVSQKYEPLPLRINHAWNAFYVDGNWYLIDATWASSAFEKNNKNAPPLVDKYFMILPNIALRSHLPAQPWWQLRHSPIKPEDFINDGAVLNDAEASDNLNYQFLDTIAYLRSLPKNEKKLYEDKSAYLYHPTESNKQAYISTMMDMVSSESQSLDENKNLLSPTEIMVAQEKLINICRSASTVGTLFQYQKELYIELLINHVVTIYNHNPGRLSKSEKQKIKLLFSEADDIIKDATPTFYIDHAIEICKEYKTAIGI